MMSVETGRVSLRLLKIGIWQKIKSSWFIPLKSDMACSPNTELGLLGLGNETHTKSSCLNRKFLAVIWVIDKR